jgi:large subunit ribosomal protein L10
MKTLERSKKRKVVDELGARLKDMQSMFLAEYSGMTVAQMTRLRRELRAIGVEFSVIKNTLLTIASEGTKAAILKEQFHGPNAIVGIYSDPVAAAKVIQGMARDIPQLKVKAGFLGKTLLDQEAIGRLASLPPREVLIARMLGMLKGTPQRLVYALSGNIGKLLGTLDAIKAQKAQA